ncbi:MAG: phage holin family protein [Oscillospiraceae bacterium]|nr:phage holin family protein [Oscillospiraceae bacterium]
MKEFWHIIQAAFAAVGAWLGYFLATAEGLVPLGSGSDGLLYALLIFVVIDYITGVMCAIDDHKLSSAVGFRGLCRKILTFMFVGIAHVLDLHVLGQAGVLRTAVIFWALANNGLSIIENSTHLGLPVPEQLKLVLEQLHDRASKSGEDADD